MKISIQTLFLPRESLPYMEEWLLYHTLIGFDSFRLYDNTGSNGAASSPFRVKYGGRVTKYGLAMISGEISDAALQAAAKKICSKFNVEIVPWPSRLFTSAVQVGAVSDHCRRGGSDYAAFIDMDEYVCIGGGLGIREFMDRKVVGGGFCGVRMRQQKMPHILRAKIKESSRVWDLRDTFSMNTRGWAPKSILPTADVVVGPNIHELTCTGGLLDQPDPEVIRINHYNTNEYQMHWLRHNHRVFDSKTPWDRIFLGESTDNHMESFREKMSSWDYLNLEDL